uniref:Uncharacterized protein n=1 Tax=Anguilla anguilla TaxID=7936 RepID=A0A0E9XMA1_ANGAN
MSHSTFLKEKRSCKIVIMTPYFMETYKNSTDTIFFFKFGWSCTGNSVHVDEAYKYFLLVIYSAQFYFNFLDVSYLKKREQKGKTKTYLQSIYILE